MIWQTDGHKALPRSAFCSLVPGIMRQEP